jgi:transcription initiation factor TFIIIB Brf1 subunit/transcription initiation factor TFIIB
MEDLKSDGLERGFNEIRHYVYALRISEDTWEVANQIYKKATESPDVSLVGRGVSVIAASCLLIACRQTGEVRTGGEIAAVSGGELKGKDIHRTTKYLCANLGLGLVVADPRDYVDRIGEKLDAPDEDIALVKHLVDVVKEDGIAVNQAANTVAATAFYFVGAYDRSHGRYTQTDISDVVDLSALTVRNNYRDYCDVLSEEDVNNFYNTQ